MSGGPRFLPVGPQILLVELAGLEETLALCDMLRTDPVPGVVAIIPAARTLMIRTGPGYAADGRLAAQILARRQIASEAPAPQDTVLELPVTYDGADLTAAADHMGLDVASLCEAHQATIWKVAFCGFAPGFAYMTCDDPRFDLPRLASPRLRIPAGSVALAGPFCGIYPSDSPGGWQLIGHCPEPVWDLARTPPALLSPGLRCRFVAHAVGRPKRPAIARPPEPAPSEGLQVVATAFPLLFQDEGRPGHEAQGVVASGALDIAALRRANRAVGNPPDSPGIEIAPGAVRLRATMPLVLALSGAAQAELAGRAIAHGTAFAVDPGDEVLIAPPRSGMRSYMALRGGFAVTPVLGSASRDTLSGIGPEPILAGAVLAPAGHPAWATGLPEPEPSLPVAGGLTELPVTLGPRSDWFSHETLERFLAQEWLVTADSSRVGIRLSGVALGRNTTRELPSEGTAAGAIQIPHSGQPVLFLADHPLTGGYPVIATLLPLALGLAAQIPPGARIRFRAQTGFAPIIPEGPA